VPGRHTERRANSPQPHPIPQPHPNPQPHPDLSDHPEHALHPSHVQGSETGALAVLEALGRGEISVAEAEGLLDALAARPRPSLEEQGAAR
jgi:hypothetical protein